MNKQIEELAKLISESEIQCSFGTLRLNKAESQDLARQLIKAGYGKAEDVRRETARDIIETIQCCKFALKDSFDIALEGMLYKIAEDYGVEVKE